MTIPSKVKVGGQNIVVGVVDEILINGEICEDGSAYLGLFDLTKGSIKLRNGLSEDIKNISFLHELVHAIHSHMGLDPRPNGPLGEQYVDGLANALYSVIQDNPELFK